MFHLLKLEWLKLRHYLLFKVIMIAYLALLPLTGMLFRIPDGPPDDFGIPSFFMFPYSWESLGYAGNWISFFLFGFLAILMVSNEFTYKTFRQNVMTGMTRQQLLTSKLLMFAVLSIFAALYYGVVSLLFGYFHTDYIKGFAKVLDGAGRVPRFALMTFGYMSFAFMITVIFRRSGLALLTYVIYTMIPEPKSSRCGQ